jgi:hypothetical protein
MKHRRGIEQISLSTLPPEWQKKLGYDPEKAKAETERAAAEQAEREAKAKATAEAEAAKAKAAAQAEIVKAREARIKAAKAVAAMVAEAKRKRTQPDPVVELQEVMKLFASKNETRAHSFDVKKTDSLVSPYTGVVEYVLPHKPERNYVFDNFQVKALFAYQDKIWVLKKICCAELTGTPPKPDSIGNWCDDEGKPNPKHIEERLKLGLDSTEIWLRSTIAEDVLWRHLLEEREQWEDALNGEYSK